MSKYIILSKENNLKNIETILTNLHHEVLLASEPIHFESDYLIVSAEFNVADLSISENTKVYSSVDFIDILSNMLVSIGTFSPKTYKLLKRVVPEKAAFLSDDEGNAQLESEYIILSHNMKKDYKLDYTIITETTAEHLNLTKNTRRRNIIFGDNTEHLKTDNNFYFGLKEDNDFIIKNIKEENDRLLFDVYLKGQMIKALNIDKRLQGYTREIVGVTALYYLENLNLDILENNLNTLI